MYEWNWRIIPLYKTVFAQGAVITIELTLWVVILGTALGIFLAYLRRSENQTLSFVATAYIEVFRAIPVLVLLIWIYYVVPILFGWSLSAYFSAVFALSLNLGAFAAETMRAGLESIPRSQFESGLVLGMKRRQVMIKIIIPQAVRNMTPNLMGLYIMELKNSSLASVIAVNEILHRSNILISETFRPLEIYTVVALAYLIIILPLENLSRSIEGYFARHDKAAFETDYGTAY